MTHRSEIFGIGSDFENKTIFPADHRINLKESEKKDKYLDLARELKKL